MPSLPVRLKELASRSERALGRKAALGPDVDLSAYSPAAAAPVGKVSLSPRGAIGKASLRAGVDLGSEDRAGTYLQVDRSVLCSRAGGGPREGVEILPVGDALYRHRWLWDLWWRLVEVDTDKYTASVALDPPEGYFIRILPGRRASAPVQSCLLMSTESSVQRVHNVIVAEEGSEAHVITGCTTHPRARSGLHIGVSEFHVRRGASLTFTMIHNWAEGFHVRPRSAALVEEGGTFVSNYIIMNPVRSIQMYPTTILAGKGARGRFQAILSGRGGSLLDVGSRTILEGKGSCSESVTRAIASSRSTILARGRLVARTDDCRGHLECRGMLSTPGAIIRAVPELEAEGVPRAELSHEAAISPIAEEEVAYLMSRGLPREEALSIIIRGFLNVDLLGLPPSLQRTVDSILAGTPLEGSGL